MKGLIIWFLLYIFVCYAIGPSGMKNLQFLNVKHNFYFIFISRGGGNLCVCVCVCFNVPYSDLIFSYIVTNRFIRGKERPN